MEIPDFFSSFLQSPQFLFFPIFEGTFFPANLSPLKDYCIRVHEYKISRASMHFFLSYFVSISFTDEFHKALLAKEYLMNSTWNIKTHGQRSIRVVTALNFGAWWWRNYSEKVKTKNNVPLESHHRGLIEGCLEMMQKLWRMVAAEALCKSLDWKSNEKGRKNIYYKLVIYCLMRPNKQLGRASINISKAFL